GLALLAESPELVGAEPYVLSNCRSLEIARKFLMMTERYKRYASRHGQDAAGNPSGGNLYRGLYNIVIKSLGASRKKPPDVVLDECIEYSERVAHRSGYFFMDSPGNDLESIAGQVASGCNVIFFVTGNGAITNFPFVPTLKVVTTSGRFNILQKETLNPKP
ncbi:uxaA, partial [Symbiodinium sp. CCMP2456]